MQSLSFAGCSMKTLRYTGLEVTTECRKLRTTVKKLTSLKDIFSEFSLLIMKVWVHSNAYKLNVNWIPEHGLGCEKIEFFWHAMWSEGRAAHTTGEKGREGIKPF